MSGAQLTLFYIFSAAAVVSALTVVTSRRSAYSVLALTVMMLALSALFVLQEAYFVAVIQILIYAGAILVLFLFVIMMLGLEGADSPLTPTLSPLGRGKPACRRGRGEGYFTRTWIQIVLAALLLAEFGFAIFHAGQLPEVAAAVVGNTEAVGDLLFTRYLLPFELISGILLIGIFGVVNLAHRRK